MKLIDEIKRFGFGAAASVGLTTVANAREMAASAAVNVLNRNFYDMFGVGQVAWMEKDKTKYITEGYCDNENVYSAVRVILQKLKVAPVILSKIKSKKLLQHVQQYKMRGDTDCQMQSRLFRCKALEEIEDENHPLLRLMNNPNSYQTRTEFQEAAAGFYVTLGETFIYKITPNDGSSRTNFPVELHVLPAHLVVPVFSGNFADPVRGYTFTMGHGQSLEIPADKILHIKTWNPNWDMQGTQLSGFSPLEAGAKSLTRNRANATAQTKAYTNGGSAYLLSSENDTKMLTQEQIDMINERIREKIQGVDNFRNITATSGMVKATKIGDTPADMELIAGDKHDRGKIASLFGVDPLLVGDKENSSYNNQEAAYKALVTNTILPILNEFSTKMGDWLIPYFAKPGEIHMEYDETVYPELQPDLKLMMEVYGRPLLSENERRSIFNWDADPDPLMNHKFIPRNLIDLEDLSSLAGAQEMQQQMTRVTRQQSQQTDGND